jgi:hypothetical protein
MLKALTIAAVIGAFAFALSFVGLSAWRSFHAKDYQTNQQSSPEKTAANSGDPTPHVGAKESPEEAIARYNLWLMIFTGVLAFVALIQIAFLLNADRTSTVAANAANKSAEIAERALIAGQRAFISAYFESVANKNLETGQIIAWSFNPLWQNAGDTPTREMQNHISIKVFDGSVPNDWDFPDMWPANTAAEDRAPTPLGAAPKGNVRGQSVGGFSIEQMREIIAGKKSILMWGWATYRDVFPNTALHVTRFAVRIIVGGDPTDAAKISFSFQFVRKYNCSDEECEQQGYPATWTPRELTE